MMGEAAEDLWESELVFVGPFGEDDEQEVEDGLFGDGCIGDD